MKKKILTTAILLTGLISASTYHYTFKFSDTSLFNNSQQVSNTPTMQDATPQERTGIPSTGQILASDGGVDWYGEVSASDLITGSQLASLINLTSGISQQSSAGWLHVGLDGKELLIAKRPFRRSLSWNNINSRNAVYGNLTVTINGQNYKLRLLNCANSNPTVDSWGFDVSHSHGSEWNRIFYRLTENVYRDSRNTKASESTFANLANYSEVDLMFEYRHGSDGSASWCQETANNFYVRRGYMGVSHFSTDSPTGVSRQTGWRPVLEKVN